MCFFIYNYFSKIYNYIKTYINNVDMEYIINNINYDNLIIDNDEIIYNNIISINPSYEYELIDDNTYYIGLCSMQNGHFMISGILPLTIFMSYTHDQLLDYLLSYSVIENNWQTIEIFKTNFYKSNNYIIYNCIIKTYFIKIIQIKWKKYIKKRNKYLSSLQFIIDLRNREIGKKIYSSKCSMIS